MIRFLLLSLFLLISASAFSQSGFTYVQSTTGEANLEPQGFPDNQNFSSPYIDEEGNVYLRTRVALIGKDFQFGLLKIDQSGEKVWVTDLPISPNRIIESSDGVLLLFMPFGNVLGVDSATGEIVWNKYIINLGNSITFLEADNNGNIIIALGSRTIFEPNLNGTIKLLSVASDGTINWTTDYVRDSESAYPYLYSPTDLVVDDQGNILISAGIDLFARRVPLFGLLLGYKSDGTPIQTSGPELVDAFTPTIENLYQKGPGILGMDALTIQGQRPHYLKNITYDYLNGIVINETTNDLPFSVVLRGFFRDNPDGSAVGVILANDVTNLEYRSFALKRLADGTVSYVNNFSQAISTIFRNGPDGNYLSLGVNEITRILDNGSIETTPLSESVRFNGYALSPTGNLIAPPSTFEYGDDFELNFIDLASGNISKRIYTIPAPALDLLSDFQIIDGNIHASFHSVDPALNETSYTRQFARDGTVENEAGSDGLKALLFTKDDNLNTYAAGVRRMENPATGFLSNFITITKTDPSGNTEWTVAEPVSSRYSTSQPDQEIQVLDNGNTLLLLNNLYYLISPAGSLISSDRIVAQASSCNQDYLYFLTANSVEQINLQTGAKISLPLPTGKFYLGLATGDANRLYISEVVQVGTSFDAFLTAYEINGSLNQVGQIGQTATDEIFRTIWQENNTLSVLTQNLSARSFSLLSLDTELNQKFTIPLDGAISLPPVVDINGRTILLYQERFSNKIDYTTYSPEGELLDNGSISPFDGPVSATAGISTLLASYSVGNSIVLKKYAYANGFLYAGGAGFTNSEEANGFLASVYIGEYSSGFTLGDISITDQPYPVNTSVQASATYEGTPPSDLTWDWGDGTQSPPSAITEAAILGTHEYPQAGVYQVTLTSGDQQALYRYVVVYNPEGGFVTGGGWITSPEGAYTADPSLTGKANFGFVSRYKKGASVPSGNTEFQFQAAGFHFQSDVYEWLVIAGKKAQYKGTGMVNGTPGYGFMLTGMDGDLYQDKQPDKFRIKIWETASGALVYDNQSGDEDNADATTVLGGGSIVIHDPKKSLTSSANMSDDPLDPAQEFEVFPVPVKEAINLRIPREYQGKTLNLLVYDMTGRVVLEQPLQASPSGINIPVRLDNETMYLLRILGTANQEVYQRMIMTR